MKKVVTLCAICAGLVAFAVAFGLIEDNARSVKQSSIDVKTDNRSVFRQLQDARIVSFNSWYMGDDDKNLTYTVQAFVQDPKYDGAGVKLSIFDEAGRVIYEDRFSEVQSIYSSYVLRKGSPQLIMEVSYGGSTSFLKMLDYQNGKVVDLMEAVKHNNDFDVNAEVRPQLRTGINPAEKPYQVLLTEGIGLASPAEKDTKVFRYKDGAYRYVGKFSTREVDDYIEKLMARSIVTTK